MKREHCLIFLVFFYGLLSGCGGGDTSGSAYQRSIFETTLSILDQNGDNIEVSKQGDPITLNFSFHNVSGEIQTLQFNSSQQYELEVYDFEIAVERYLFDPIDVVIILTDTDSEVYGLVEDIFDKIITSILPGGIKNT